MVTVEVVLSTGLCVSAVEPVVEDVALEAERPIDALELLVRTATFDGLFVALLAAVAGGGDALAALRLDASSPAVPVSTLVTALSPAALVLATFTGGEVFDSATLAAGGAAREAVPEGVT